MKRFSCLLFALFFLAPGLGSSQEPQLPRDPGKLVERAQKFWAAIASGDRLQALDFVLPEKKKLFISGSAAPVLKVEVLGLDLTGDINRGKVRIHLETLTLTGLGNWITTDSWVWRDRNWYADVVNIADFFPKGGPGPLVDEKQVRQELETKFEILRNPLDIGALINGDISTFEVPIRYAGDAPISIEVGLPNPLLDIDNASRQISPGSTNFILVVDTTNWEGSFDFPLPLKIQSQGVTVERVLHVKGNVLVPLAFRQVPPEVQLALGKEFSVFLRNNTKQEAEIQFLTVGGKLDILTDLKNLPPDQEVKVDFRYRPDQIPDTMEVRLRTPIQGRSSFTYRFRNVHP
jgi:hypothetical protein